MCIKYTSVSQSHTSFAAVKKRFQQIHTIFYFMCAWVLCQLQGTSLLKFGRFQSNEIST